MAYNAVLSIDGCGFRGRTQLLVLEELMQRMRASPSDPVKRPCDVFDLIVGTAAGGLIAILLGRLGMHCGDAIKAYEELERVLFLDTAHSNPPTIKDILTNPSKFNSLNFENKLKTIITGALGPQAKTFMFDTANRTGCKTLVTLVNQNAVTDKDAYRIRSYKDPKLIPDVEPITGHIWEIWEAAIGATGCPRLFSPLNLQGSLFQAANASGFSNPSMIAYIEALDLFGNNANITLVSLGMGLRNPDNYSSTVTEGEINDALALIAKDLDKIGDNNLREFVRQAQLAATSTQIKHLRVAERIGRAGPSQNYHRFDPPRGNSPLIMVDFGQEQVIDVIVATYLQNQIYAKMWTDAIGNLRAALSMEWQWQVLDDYTCDSDPSKTVKKFPPGLKAPMQVMLECYDWEASAGNSSRQIISCFTIDNNGESEMITGPVDTKREGNSKLYVRVLLDDKWRFFPGRRFRFRVKLEDDVLHGKTSFSSQVEALQTASTDANIKAFNFDGWGTKNVITDKDLVRDNDATLTSGVWIRN